MIVLLLFIAPIVQIIWSAARINGKTKFPIIVIATVSFALGVVLSFCTAVIFQQVVPKSPQHGPDGPGIVGVYLGILGLFANLISAVAIGSLCSLTDWIIKRFGLTS